MDQTQLQEKIALYYQKLPEETKVLFAGMSWLEILKEIDVKYLLNEEQIKTLGTETTLLLLGVIDLEGYVENIRAEIKIESIKIDAILDEVGEKILKDVAPLLYETYNNNVAELMKEKYGNKFDERLSSLPKKIKEAIDDSNYQTSIYQIGQKHGLNISQIGDLEEVTTKVMVGTINPSQYENELKVKISTEKTKEILPEINEAVFKNIKEILKENWDKIENEDIPLPPYAIKKEDIVPLPPPSYNNEVKIVEVEQKKVEPNEEIGRDESNFYMKHGVEILQNENHEEKEEQSIKTGFEKSGMNILMEKLVNPSTSKTTVSNYSIPNKISQIEHLPQTSGDAQKKPHDPYHEEI